MHSLWMHKDTVGLVPTSSSVTLTQSQCHTSSQQAIFATTDTRMQTSSSAAAERPCDALCQSVVSLDKIITRVASFNIVTDASDLPLHKIQVSRHTLLRVKKSVPEVQYVERTVWRRLSRDLAQSPLCHDMNALDDMSVDDLVQLYDQQMTDLLDTHCPLFTVHCRNKLVATLSVVRCRLPSARRHAWSAKKRFRRTRSVANKQA